MKRIPKILSYILIINNKLFTSIYAASLLQTYGSYSGAICLAKLSALM